MNIGFVVCGAMALLCLMLAVMFTVGKEKASIIISGFHEKSKEERALYDEVKLCRDHRNMFLLYTVIYFIGAVGSQFFTSYTAIVSFIIWLIVFSQDVHFDDEKAFGKYKI